MKKVKTFKTVSGYLRNAEYSIKGKPNTDEERDGERRVLNHLLPQHGIGTIEDNEKPRDGIERLLKQTTDSRQLKTLQSCSRWLGRWKIVSTRAVPQIKTADGLVPYLVYGFRRGDTKSNVRILIDAEEIGGERPSAIAEKIAGPDYCFHATMNLNKPVPDEAKNRLFHSDDELYAAAPSSITAHRGNAASHDNSSLLGVARRGGAAFTVGGTAMAEHENSIGESDDWHTPLEIFAKLKLRFDLDPCAPLDRTHYFVPAKKIYTIEDDGTAATMARARVHESSVRRTPGPRAMVAAVL